MRLTIWQQFSSNHSSRFTIVGKFPSEQEAKRAYAFWLDFIVKVQEYYRTQLDPNRYLDEPAPLSPIEEEFIAKYGLKEWYEQPIDWLGTEFHEIPHVLRRMGEHLFLSVEFETHQRAYPAHALMKAIGARALAVTDESLFLKISGEAPNNETALQIASDLERTNDVQMRGLWTSGVIWSFGEFIPEVNDAVIELKIEHVWIGNLVTAISVISRYLEIRGCQNIAFNFGALEERWQ